MRPPRCCPRCWITVNSQCVHDTLTARALRDRRESVWVIPLMAFFFVLAICVQFYVIWFLERPIVLLTLLVLFFVAVVFIVFDEYPYPFKSTNRWSFSQESDEFRQDMTHFLIAMLLVSVFGLLGIIFLTGAIGTLAFALSNCSVLFFLLAGYLYLMTYNYVVEEEEDERDAFI